MKQPSEEEMILHFYGEAADTAAFERALAADPELAARYAALRAELLALSALPELAQIATPAADPELAGRVWRAIRPRLDPHRAAAGPFGFVKSLGASLALRPGFALAAAATLALVAGYLLGRNNRDAPAVTPIAASLALSPAARERLLLASVGDHLGGSERLLTSLANAPSTDASALAEQSRWAASLAASNRLYRSAAERAGQRRIVALLDELEPLLLELAHAPADSAEELSATKRRIDDNDLLFKLRVAGERLDRDARTAPKNPRTTTTS